jgi:hypothetical protein
MFAEGTRQRQMHRLRDDSREITVALPAFFFQQVGSGTVKLRRGAARKTFMSFSPRHLSLNGFQNNIAQGAGLLAGIATKPVMQFFGNVLDLDVGDEKR